MSEQFTQQFKDQANAEIFSAFRSAQRNLRSALKSADNSHFGSRYADLPSVMEAFKEAFNPEGFSVSQTVEGHFMTMPVPAPTPDNKNNTAEACVYTGNLITSILHVSGARWTSDTPIFVAKPDAQKLGSAITYARRYGLMAAAGIVADDDDDGNAASDRGAVPDRRETGLYPKSQSQQATQADLDEYVQAAEAGDLVRARAVYAAVKATFGDNVAFLNATKKITEKKQ